jgi:hypothetical protein
MTKPSQATMLVALAQTEGIQLWHDAEGRAFATIPKADHLEHHRLRSSLVRSWLSGLAYHQLGISLGSEAMQTAITTLEGIAVHDGAHNPVCTRLAGQNGNIYLDLANDRWQAVEVGPSGWRLVDDFPVRFRRAPGMKPLPTPVHGGRLNMLHSLINVRSMDWALFVAWLVQAARDRGPYPILAIYGEQGSAKSTGARLLRNTIDPNWAPLRSPPKEVRDLAIAATNGWVVALDNLSYLPHWLSDALCVLSTGGGFATRTLYTDDEESIFSFRRPVIINGIAEVAERGDLIVSLL